MLQTVTTFYLIRHGDNDLVGKAIAGWTPGVHLNASGKAQAEHLADHLANAGIGRIYSSPLERAQETAAPLAARLDVPVHISESIGEVHFGEWTGQRFDALANDIRWRRWNAFRSGNRAPQGETMLEVQTRFLTFLLKLAAEFPEEGAIALFSHGDPIRTALLFYLGMPLDFYQRIEISPASVSILKLSNESAQVVCLNRTW